MPRWYYKMISSLASSRHLSDKDKEEDKAHGQNQLAAFGACTNAGPTLSPAAFSF